MATIRKKGDYQWHAQIRRKGFQNQTRTFDTRAEAEKWAAIVESEMARGVFRSVAEAEKTTVGEVIDRYEAEILPGKKGIAPDRARLKTLHGEFGSMILASVTSAHVARFRDKRMKIVSAQSVIHEINLLNRVLKAAAIDFGIVLPHGLPTALIRKPKKPRGRDRRLEPGELDKIIEATGSPELGAIVLLAVETAMRRGEIAGLLRSNINLKKRTLVLPDTKNGESRVVPLSSRAVDLLSSLSPRISGRVFGMNPDSITQAFDRACFRAGIDDLRFHDLRHEAASRLFEKGLNPMEVASITGHKTLQMLKRYTHLRAEELAKKLG